ncbi:MAG: YfiR family protein [Gammaproteobacteria bacterium]
MMQFIRMFSIALLALTMSVGQGWAMDQRELTIKAAYLFRLSLFVEWPSANLNSSGSEPILFCIAAPPDIIESLKRILAEKTINQHKIVVFGVDLNDDLASCHLLYLPEFIQKPQLYLEAAAHHSVLTIGESEAFYRQGGMIFLFKKHNTIRFAINEQVAKKAGLELRAQLLHLAEQQP